MLLAAAYIFGHFIQAIANSVYSRNRWRPENTIDSVIPAEIRAVLNDAACSVAGLDRTQQLSGPLIYDIADHFVLQHGKVAERDVYVYREGFYRGMTVGLLLLAVGCFCRMVAPASLQVLGVVITIAAWPLFWIGLAALSVLALFVKRYFRFANYRVKYALYSFLALETRKGEAVE